MHAHGRRLRAPGAATTLALLAALVVSAPGEATAAPVGAVAVRTAAPADNPIDTSSESAVRQAWADRWVPASKTPMALTGGSTTSCTGFATSATQQQATLDAVNFARGLVGESGVAFTAAYDQAAADAALIMAANGQLSHDPPKTWSCWTQSSHDAAGRSNILLNSATPNASRIAELYLDEPGAGNTAVGHRRWLLRPEATTMGSGNAKGDWFANAMYVFTFADDNAGAPARPYYAWPSAGYFPYPLEPAGRWSLSSSSGATFASAHVTVTGPDGAPVAVTQHAVASGYADNTLAWNLTTPAAVTSSVAQSYRVTVTGISGGPASSYTYFVRLFDPTAAAQPGEPASLTVDQPVPDRVATSTRIAVSRRHTKRHGRITVRLSATAANGQRPAGRIALYVGHKRVGSWAVGPSNRASASLRIGWPRKGRKPLHAVFEDNGTYAGSTSQTLAVRVN